MIGFFIVAAVLLLAALALIVYPLMRGRDHGPEDRRADVIGLSRDRLEEIKAKRKSGEIDESEYEEQVADLEAQLADDLSSQDPDEGGEAPAADPERRGGQWIGFAVIAFVPLLTGLLYLTLGSPQALVTDTRSAAPVSAEGDDHPQNVESMVAGLAAKLEKNPDDPDGWFMLGRSYMQMNRYGEAAEAFSRLRALVGDVPEVLVREASARALQRGGKLAGKPAELVQQALSQAPDHPQALWLAATAAYQAGDRQEALGYYRRVAPMLEGQPRQQVQSMIRELGGTVDEEAPAVSSSQPDSAPVEQAASASLQVQVNLDPGLRDRAAPDQTVFIFAKAVNGPPMPLAVVRKTVADLPVTVTLDESQAMVPQMTLARFDRVTVGARISGSGQPVAQPGDLEGESEPVSTNTSQTVDITIDSIVPEQ
jgi:cytochrome c-type biogenesis protein CcmH